MNDRTQARVALTMTTVAFGVCFAAWMLYGVMLTYLVNEQVFAFKRSELGWLLGIPVLTGSLFRLPVGVLADRFGGRAVLTGLMLLSAVPMYCVSMADGFWSFLWAGLGFGLVGASFAAGVAYVSAWFPPQRIGTALGIFGTGNVGAAFTGSCGPLLLQWLTERGSHPEGWRTLPKLYALMLILTAIVFALVVRTRTPDASAARTLLQRLAPLKSARVWRFGLYYFLLFGGFVALTNWLIPYYVNTYQTSVATAGLLTSFFSIPSSVIRAAGGWMSDRWGARTMMYWVLVITAIGCGLLSVPRLSIETPGEGIMATAAGTVTRVTDSMIVIGDQEYRLRPRPSTDPAAEKDAFLPLPVMRQWHAPLVEPGQKVLRRDLLASGVTHIFFQANMTIFTVLLFVVGTAMGIGMAAVYKHIPVYFPNSVGMTGGIVGVIGGLGGMVCPILFGYLLNLSGLWTSCWMFLGVSSILCLAWMHLVIQRMLAEQAPLLAQRIDR
ncbi:MAG: nitrate/nitrite transporter [Planctomycetaceae bacterium]